MTVPSSERVKLVSLLSTVGFLSLAACTNDGTDETRSDLLDRSASEAAASSGEVDFTHIRDLSLDSQGNIYVLDSPFDVPVLSPGGDLLRRVGRQGAGPGEFRGISWAGFGGDDTLFVYDMELSRLTEFAPGSGSIGSIVHLRQEYPLYPATVRRIPDGRLLGIYRRVYAEDAGREEGKPGTDLVRLLGADGEVLQDSVLLLREQQPIEISDGSWGAVFRNPFGRRTVLRVASDGRIFTAWTDSARFEVHSPEGELLQTIEARDPPAPRPVTAAERDSLIAAYSPDGQRAPAIRRALDRLNHRTWPLVQDFILDDRDRIWYAAVPQRGDTINSWVALDARGNAVERLTLPVNATPHVIRGARAYVSETDSLDVPRVVIYDLQPAPARRDE